MLKSQLKFFNPAVIPSCGVMVKKIISIMVSAAFFAASLLAMQGSGVLASEEPETLEEARARKQELDRRELEARTQIDLVNAELAEVADAYNSATILLERQTIKVDAARQGVKLAQASYAQAQVDLAESEAELAAFKAQLKDVALAAYLEIQEDQDSLLLSSADLNQGVKKKAIIDLVSVNTGDFLDQLRLVEQDNLVAQKVANDALLEIQTTERELNEEIITLEKDKERLASLQVELENRSQELQALIAAFEQESRELQDFIQRKETEQRARDLGGSDKYIWPTAGGVAGGFGQRWHPILKYWRPHNGLDIGGQHGQPIWAAHTGIVIVSDFGKGYGNYIVLDHGDGTTSIYAHMSSRGVAVAAEVFVGEEIGRVGSTGLSTGPHLHFEIREDGVPVDPLKYLPPRN